MLTASAELWGLMLPIVGIFPGAWRTVHLHQVPAVLAKCCKAHPNAVGAFRLLRLLS